MLRPDPRRASAGSVRVANHAGAAPKMIPVSSANPNANPRTVNEGTVLTGRNWELWKASVSSSRAAAIATTSPAIPPPTASKTLSVRACATICRRAPTARRTAACPRRATARASSRLATLAQAISSTNPQTASRICKLRPYLLSSRRRRHLRGRRLLPASGAFGSRPASSSPDNRNHSASIAAALP